MEQLLCYGILSATAAYPKQCLIEDLLKRGLQDHTLNFNYVYRLMYPLLQSACK